MDASHRTECLEDTRTDILDFIMDWAIHPTGDQNVLCLHGVAGSGKSTIATTVANRLRQQGLLGAFVFCERDIAHRNDPLLVVRTIAYQIGLHDEKLGAAISSVIEKYPSVSEFSLPSQFEQLLANILPKVLITAEPSEEQIANERHSISALSSQFQQLLVNILPKFYTAVIPNERPKFVVVVLDALDECGTPGKRDVLLKVLAELTNGIFCLRFIITTRPEIDIQSALSFRPHICMQELIISSQSNTKDILTYFKTRLSQKQRQTSYLKGNDDWPGEEKLQSLVMRASGLFIWATTAATFITQGYNPDSHLATILSGSYSSKSEGALDDLYQTALRCTGDWDDIEFVEDFRSVIGIVLVAQQPLTPDAIDQLRGNSGNHPPCAHIISLLACLVHLRPVRLVHPSFADFLFTHSRCSQKYWLFDHDTLHRALAIQCINHLHRALKQNTCNLTLSPDPVNEHLSEATKYACKHWVEHFVKVNSADRDFLRALEVFLFQHLLHWVEALSILRFSRYAVGLLQRLYSWLVISVAEPQLLQLINDGVRFVQRYANLIETHPLLIYASALPFTPPDTLLYQTFHDPRVYPTSWGLVEQSWSPLLQVLSGHWDSVTSVAYSPDGHRVVSGSGDGEVRVWDVTSGTEAFPPLTDHWLRVNSVAFSPDGARIVSCSHDQIIRRWDASSGLQVLPPMRGHTHRVNSVVYSPDGRLVISGSDDKTVRVWDASSGAEVRPPLQGHTNSIFSVSCSQTCIASGAVDGRIRVWDIASGLEVAPSIKGHTKAVSSVAFSPNGDFLVSGSLDGAIRLWDINSGDQIPHAFEGHSASVNSVAFSPDNAHIVSGSGDKTIRVWSVATGAELMPRLLYGNAAIKAVAFSPDGTRIVSGSSGMIVQVWDATSRASVPFSKGHTKSVNSIAFSADGSRLVSGSYDRTVCVWNAASGTQLLPPLRRNSDWTGSVAFSEDGCYIFMKDAGHVEYVWDATSGTRIHGKEPVAAMDLTGELDLDVIRGWITDRVTGEYLSKLPSTSYIYNQCSHGRSLAAGQQSGDVFVMHFPPRP